MVEDTRATSRAVKLRSVSDAPRLRPLGQPHVVTVHTDKFGEPEFVSLPGKPTRHVEIIREHWRIDEGWWRQPMSREYRTVILDGGGNITLYHDLLKGLWYVQRA